MFRCGFRKNPILEFTLSMQWSWNEISRIYFYRVSGMSIYSRAIKDLACLGLIPECLCAQKTLPGPRSFSDMIECTSGDSLQRG